MSTTNSIPTLNGDGEFKAYVARPADEPKAAIVVIQEIFGVNAGIRRKADKLAEAGYLAVAPDLFWRFEPGIELDPDVEDEMQQAFDYFGKFDFDQAVKDLESTVHWVRREEGVPNVGCVGGSWLTPADAVRAGDWARVTQLARAAADLRGA